ncbi:hypothetical protein B0H21DRAFT_688447 [Amylocystis lapponica]|nr:hypothetical protein B0H21DRAFT_688447 [Amylocystis lapponica]
MSPDRESFIDLASPTFSPASPEFPHSDIPGAPPPAPRPSIPPSSTLYHAYDSNAKPHLPRLTTDAKPPLPTTPKPVFSRRSRSAQPPSSKSRHRDDARKFEGFSPDSEQNDVLPATTNHLHPRERADRVRKTRKLTQLFGQTPGTMERSPEEDVTSNGCLPMPSPLNLTLTKRKHHRAAVSMSDDGVLPTHPAQRRAAWPPPEDTQYIHVGGRRHSTPLSPQEFLDSASILDVAGTDHVIEIGPQEGAPHSDTDSLAGHGAPEPGSPMSFIDLSEEDIPRDALSDGPSVDTPRLPRHPFASTFPSTPSVADTISSEQQAEEDRRRKREKLAKLHRFLGSRVPAHLVLGPLDEGVPLPPPALPSSGSVMDDNDEEDSRGVRMRRRRSSSAAEFSRTWSDDIDRLKEELNEREKAINVRRAVKMEKMFGVAPPQMLYHTRQAVSSPGSITALTVPKPKLSSSPKVSSQAQSPSIPSGRHPKLNKGKPKKTGRPGTAESAKPLLTSEGDDFADPSPTVSDVYLHYRHSLNSLNDIIDRDDKQSLADLHDYLSGLHDTPPHSPSAEPIEVTTAASKAERRRSLPVRTSMTSTISDFSLLSPDAEETTFQQRRRKAAKLTQFFGVNYRDLMSDVLESIEKGLEEERGKGTLRPDEVKDLQQKLVRLKTKRNKFS